MLNLEYFFFLNKTYKCSEIASSCYVSSMYFEINFHNDSSSYVYFGDIFIRINLDVLP